MLCLVNVTKSSIQLMRCDQPNTGRFPSDCGVYQTEGLTIVTEGFFLNSEQLLEASGDSSICEFIAHTYRERPDELYTILKGSFAVAVIDEHSGFAIVFNDLLSKQPLYWCNADGKLAFSTSFWELVTCVKDNGFHLTLDTRAIDMMNVCCSLMEDVTYCNEIHFIKPFCRLNIDGSGVKTVQQPFPQINKEISTDEIISTLDRLFLEGTRLQFRKNKQFGYTQISSLSGGMDSRAVLLYGRKAGYKTELTFTYAESGSDDMHIAARVAKEYGCENRFNPLDGGMFMLEREQLAERNEGMMYYAGTTGLLGAIKMLDDVNPGIVHAGIGGGEILGDILADQSGCDKEQSIAQYLHTYGLSGDDCANMAHACADIYPDYYTFRNLQDLRTCLNFAYTSRRNFAVASPFLYEDFYTYLLSVPFAAKYQRKLYREWYKRCIDTDIPVTYYGNINRQSDSQRRLRRFTRRVENVLMRTVLFGRVKLRREMNPFDIWAHRNKLLLPTLDSMFTNDMAMLSDYDEVLLDKLRLAYSGDIRSRLRVLTSTWVLVKLREYI